MIQFLFERGIHLPDLDRFMCRPTMTTAHHPTVMLTNPAIIGPFFHVKMIDETPGPFEEPQVVWDAVYQTNKPALIDNDAQMISHHLMPKSREFLGFCPAKRSRHKYTISVTPCDTDGNSLIAPGGFGSFSVDGLMVPNKFL